MSTRRPFAGCALALAVILAVTPSPSWADPCPFDVNGDGVPELVAPDADDNGVCEWPPGSRTFKGALTFEEGVLVDFSGSTSITADRIVVEPGAILNGNRRQLTRLALIARGSSQGDIFSGGALFIQASDDITLKARESLGLSGLTNLEAGDRLTLQATTGNVLVRGRDDVLFDLFARNRIDVYARGATGSMFLDGAKVGASRVVLTTRANVSVVGEKKLELGNGTFVTTDRDDTALPTESYVNLDATGTIIVTESDIDAGAQASFRTARLEDDVCLSHDTTLEAGDGLGRIVFSAVHGTVFDDGTTSFVGRILGGERLVQGKCPPEDD